MPAIEGEARDNTQDWIVPAGTVPLLSELEARIDEALVIARSSEEGVREVGEMALDAARQARRAAEAAEAASVAAAAAVAAGPRVELGPAVTPGPRFEPEPEAGPQPAAAPTSSVKSVFSNGTSRPRPEDAKARLRNFNERADRLLARLQAV